MVMQFLGLLFPKEKENIIRKKSRQNSVQNQSNLFQWNIIDGLIINQQKVHIINCLPVGTYPSQYTDLLLKTEKWSYQNQDNLQIGSINLPFVKQIMREISIKKELQKSNDYNILIYSTYLPFLRAVNKLDKRFNISLIVTDLPEFYDLNRTTWFKRLLRKNNNNLIYKYLKRIDSFVLLTEKMKEPLHVGNKPYVVVEGIHSKNNNLTHKKDQKSKNIVFYSGTLRYIYGIKNLLDAFKLIEDKNTELWICGSGEADEDIKLYAKSDSRIHYFGFCSNAEVSELRAKATVLVNPRHNDGEYTKYSFPSKTMEYLASGIPVVAYKLDGIPDEYDDYLNYVSDNSPEALARKIVEIYDDKSGKYTRRAYEGRMFVIRQKSPSIQAQKVIKMMIDNAQ